jgi:16S rRNA (cytosine1402-N4)-methyltransferase
MEHFKDPTRGFSIKYDGPLDMRFDPKNPITAEWILKNYSFDQLKEVFAKY